MEEHLDELRELAADRHAKPLPRHVVQSFQAFLLTVRRDVATGEAGAQTSGSSSLGLASWHA
ncbi:MAG: hypothetical protein JRI23_10380 [Deltaproteobacteria bacterium]|nr:hypothetical protein [Deltaproteobacteria bacterium]MBW2532075.1 hypothetical protein [Deltaproteobacteria bacterium]